MAKPVILSGIQPTGNLHVGNYLGAVKNWVDLQESGRYDCFFSIVDYHSLTGGMSAEARREQTRTTAIELLSAGLDPKKITLFVQSSIPEVTELAWIFNTVTPVAELARMTQFKDKSGSQKENINAGLFTYPILQAADILIVHGGFVPVGEDQVQHVELTRDIVRWFNARYGEYFKEPKALLTDIPRVKSLLAPEKKMSKSLGEGHVIELQDEPEIIEKKMKRAVTATEGGKGAPGAQNLLLLLKHFGESALYHQFVKAEKDGSIRYGDLKHEASLAIASHFSIYRTRRAELLKKKKYVAEVLEEGAEAVRKIAEKTMKEVRSRVGI